MLILMIITFATSKRIGMGLAASIRGYEASTFSILSFGLRNASSCSGPSFFTSLSVSIPVGGICGSSDFVEWQLVVELCSIIFRDLFGVITAAHRELNIFFEGLMSCLWFGLAESGIILFPLIEEESFCGKGIDMEF